MKKLFAIAFNCVNLLLAVGVVHTTLYCLDRESYRSPCPNRSHLKSTNLVPQNQNFSHTVTFTDIEEYFLVCHLSTNRFFA